MGDTLMKLNILFILLFLVVSFTEAKAQVASEPSKRELTSKEMLKNLGNAQLHNSIYHHTDYY